MSAKACVRKPGFGVFVVITTLSAPWTSTLATSRNGVEKRPWMFFCRYSTVNFTSSALKGLPSCHLTPDSRVNVQTLLSGLACTCFASHGCGSLFRSKAISVSNCISSTGQPGYPEMYVYGFQLLSSLVVPIFRRSICLAAAGLPPAGVFWPVDGGAVHPAMIERPSAIAKSRRSDTIRPSPRENSGSIPLPGREGRGSNRSPARLGGRRDRHRDRPIHSGSSARVPRPHGKIHRQPTPCVHPSVEGAGGRARRV